MRGFKLEILLGVSAIVLGLTLPVFARADDGIVVHGEVMSAVDTNKDGKVSKAEWKAATDVRYKKSDADGNGSVSREELTAERDHAAEAMRKKSGDELFQRTDTNGDGKISQTEYEALSDKIYLRLQNQKAVGAPPAEAE